MKKKLIFIPFLFIPFSMVTSCNSKGNQLTIWVDSKIAELTRNQINNFLKENPDCKYTYRVDTVSEQTAATQMIVDVESGADLYVFAQDQFSRLISAGALASLPTHEVEEQGIEYDVSTRNILSTVDACKHTDSTGKKRMYAYPVTNDNGYFLYYDKRSLSEDEVKTINGILSKTSSSQKKYFAYSLTDGFWYSAGFFFSREIDTSGGKTTYGDPICKSEWTVNPDGTFKDKDDTFCSYNGVIAAKIIQDVYTHDGWLDSHNAGMLGRPEEGGGGAIALVSGTWDYGTAKDKLGNNLGITVLPTFNIGGVDYQTGSFSGCKLMGVKPQTDVNRSIWCARLASYLTNETCQLERFNSVGWGPSNINAAAKPEVIKDPAIEAINNQNKFAVAQGCYPDKWFKFGEQKIVATIKEKREKKGSDLTASELYSCLQGYKGVIDELAPDKGK